MNRWLGLQPTFAGSRLLIGVSSLSIDCDIGVEHGFSSLSSDCDMEVEHGVSSLSIQCGIKFEQLRARNILT